MVRGLLVRLEDSDRQTMGAIHLYDGPVCVFQAQTLELAWKQNERNVSRIPAGVYEVRERTSEKYGTHYHLQDVPDRDWVLIHPANYFSSLRGCIAVGNAVADINGDGFLDVTHSRATMMRLLRAAGSRWELTITDDMIR